jgi:hypothetical protein
MPKKCCCFLPKKIGKFLENVFFLLVLIQVILLFLGGNFIFFNLKYLFKFGEKTMIIDIGFAYPNLNYFSPSWDGGQIQGTYPR